MAKYRVLKTDSIGAKYKGKKSVNNIRLYPKTNVQKKRK